MKRLLFVLLLMCVPAIAQAQLTGVFLGTTEDITGNYVPTPDGFKDWQILIRGLKFQPQTIIVTADEERRWETPINPSFWIVAPIYGANKDADLFMSIAGSIPVSGFHVQVTYADATIDEVQISSAIAVQPLSKLQWDQDALSLFDVQELSARVYVDNSGGSYTTIPPTAITCTGNAPTFICLTNFPSIPLTTGTHTLMISVVNKANYESGKSNTVNFVLAVIASPRNLTLIP